MTRDDDADAGFWESTWREREDAVRQAFGETEPAGNVFAFSWEEVRVPGACALAFPPVPERRDAVERRDHWLYLTLGLSQPLNREQVRRERAAGKRYSSFGFELGLLTENRSDWAVDALELYLGHITARSVALKWGDRFAFGFHERPGRLSVFTGSPENAGVRAVGDIRAMLFWKYLARPSSFVTRTGNFLVLVGTGITADEWDLAKATTTAHVLLLLCRAGVGQTTDPFRKSVLNDPRSAEEWHRIKGLSGEQAAEELTKTSPAP